MKNTKIVTNNVCFCSSTMLTSKIITEIIENHSEFFGCSKSCNDYVSIRSWWTTKLPMILLWKTVVLVGGGGQAHPQKFWFAENLGNIPENPRENGAQPCLTLKHCAQGLQKITWMKTFFGGHTKKGLHDLLGRESVGQTCTKSFRESLGKFGQKSFVTPKIFLLLNLWWKGTSAPVAPLLKGQRDECPCHASTFRRPCAYNRHALYSLKSHKNWVCA